MKRCKCGRWPVLKIVTTVIVDVEKGKVGEPRITYDVESRCVCSEKKMNWLDWLVIMGILLSTIGLIWAWVFSLLRVM